MAEAGQDSSMPSAASPVGETSPTLTADLICARCGYNLRGLPADGRCPECFTPVARSVHGNLLRFADPAWVDTLRRGTLIWLWSMLVALVAYGGGAVLAGFAGPGVIKNILSVIAAAVTLWAIILVTAPEPMIAAEDDPVTLRRFARWAAIVSFAGEASQLVQQVSPVASWFFVVVAIVIFVGIAASVAQFLYLRRLALRVPDQELASMTKTVMWGFVGALTALLGLVVAVGVIPLAGGGGGGATPQPSGGTAVVLIMLTCVAVLGFVVFSIWWIVLLFRYHRAFKDAAAEARRLASHPAVTASQPVTDAPHPGWPPST